MATVNKIMKTFNVPNGNDVVCYEIVDDKGRKAIAKDWASNSTAAYDVGEYTMKDGVVYRFKAPHKANTAWNASEVDATNLGAELTSFHGDMKALDGKKANADSMFLYKSALPGSVVEVEDAVAECVKQMQIEIAPVQDLHGYDKPWVGGAGKNKFRGKTDSIAGITFTYNENTSEFTLNGTATDNAILTILLPAALPAGDYTLSGNNDVANSNVAIRGEYSNGTVAGGSSGNLFLTSVNGTLTITATSPIAKVAVRVASGATLSNFKLKPQIESGSTATSFEPYSNICPISGHTGCEIVRTGKNLFDKSTVKLGYIDANGNLQSATGDTPYRHSDLMRCEPSSVYMFSLTHSNSANEIKRIHEYDIYGNWLRQIDTINVGGSTTEYSKLISTSEKAAFIVVTFSLADTNIQFEKGSVATNYEDSAMKYTIQFPSPTPGTVYGGTLTLNQDGTGTLVVDRAFVTITQESQVARDGARVYRIKSDATPGVKLTPPATVVCDKIKSEIGDIQDDRIYIEGGNISGIRIRTSSQYASSQEMLTALGGDFEVVYPLSTALSYSLSIDQVHLLLGYNTLYASTGSILSMLYPTSQVEAVAHAKADGILETSSTPSAVMSFSDGADGIPMGVEVAIEPVQDLHGYDKPWVGGAGKNLLKMLTLTELKSNLTGGTWSGNTFSINNANITFTAGEDDIIRSFSVSTTAAVSQNIQIVFSSVGRWLSDTDLSNGVVLSGCPSGGSSDSYYLLFRFTNGTSWKDTGSSVAFTTDNSNNFDVRFIIIAGTTMSNKVFYPMIRLSSVTDATWEPYSNICPISGFDHAEVTRTGKNLVDISEISYNKYLNGTGSLEVNNDCYVTGYIHFFAGQKIYIPATGTARRCTYDKDKKFVSYLNVSTAQVLNPNFEGYLRVSSRYDTLAVENIQIEYGESATEYETPDIKHYSIAFPTSAGTVYGGTLTVNKDGSVVLVVDRANVDISTLTIAGTSGGGLAFCDITGSKFNVDTVLSDRYPIIANNETGWVSTVPCITRTSGTTVRVIGTQGMAGQLVYGLATALTYNIPAPIIKSLLGQNNVWASTGNVNSAEWSADTKSYIDNLFSSITSAVGQTF